MDEEQQLPDIDAKVAYHDSNLGRCRLNNLKCSGGDCRRCSFVTDASLMLVINDLNTELAHVRMLLGDKCDGEKCGEDCDCGCDCDCGKE
jgi:hypothetical protein